jgi:hypothetical protein
LQAHSGPILRIQAELAYIFLHFPLILQAVFQAGMKIRNALSESIFAHAYGSYERHNGVSLGGRCSDGCLSSFCRFVHALRSLLARETPRSRRIESNENYFMGSCRYFSSMMQNPFSLGDEWKKSRQN